MLLALSVLLPGSIFAHGGFHERIAELMTKALDQPSDPTVYLELGDLQGQHGELDSALRDLERVDALAPGKFFTDFLRGQAWLVAGDFAKAEQALDRHLASHPEEARGWLLRARARHGLGHDEASLADYREALKRTAAPDPDLVQEVADALASHNSQTEAAEVLNDGMARLGKIPSLLLRAIELDVATKDYDAALRRIEEASAAAPRPEPWMARRATVLAQAGRSKESTEAWKELEERIDSLPQRERTSYAMSSIRDEARHALASASASPAANESASNPTPSKP